MALPSVLFIIVCVFSSCKSDEELKVEEQKEQIKIEKQLDSLKGPYSLRRFRVFDQVDGKSHSSFFLIGGSTFTAIDVDRKIGFYWLSHEKQYIYTVLKMTDVRVVIDSTAHIPFIEYEFYDYKFDHRVEYNIKENLYYCLIHTKESDFPQDVNLGELK